MRLISKVLVLMLTVSGAWASTSSVIPFDPAPTGLADTAPMCSQNLQIERGGDAVPWPWGSEVRFPWTAIQGVWAPLSGDCGTYFVFQVGGNAGSAERFVQVTQYDPRTCKKLATGAGFENSRVIYASMTTGTKSFDLTIRAFDNAILKGDLSGGHERTSPNYSVGTPDATAPAGSVVVLSMYPRRNWEKRESYELQKLQSSPSLLCE